MKLVHRHYGHALAVVCVVATTAGAQQPSLQTRMIAVDRKVVRVQFAGLARRAASTPVVVFEAGTGNALEVWGTIVAQIAEVAPVVAYDRAGLGRSAWDGVPPTPHRVTERLRVVLDRIGAKPPYVLVGYSWGGMLARYFAGKHSNEVAGLVFVDPGPLMTENIAERLVPFAAIGAGRAGYDAYWARLQKLLQTAPAPMRAEVDVLYDIMKRERPDPELRQLPAVPIVVVIAGKYRDVPLQVPFDMRAHFEADLRHRIKVFQEWALKSPRGSVVVSNHSTHAIPREDPELIVWAVKRVLSGSRAATAPSR
jgi:pimeloyl-ACP methyl ester carboxylesterase